MRGSDFAGLLDNFKATAAHFEQFKLERVPRKVKNRGDREREADQEHNKRPHQSDKGEASDNEVDLMVGKFSLGFLFILVWDF